MIKTIESIRRSMKVRRLLPDVRLCAAVLMFIFQASVFPERNHGQDPDSNGDSLTELVANLRKENQLVGLAAMVMVDGKVVHSGVDGERENGSGLALKIGDRWHLGSITKSITATMIARLVESGKMKWSDSVGTYFPDETIHEDWRPVTLGQLLTHTAGAPPNFSIWVLLQRPEPGPECTKVRRRAVLDVVAAKPAYPPGEKFVYSNVGFTIAGAMAEKATGVSWSDLVKREVFAPLKLTGTGFGPPKSSDKTVEQPRGHRVVLGWKVSADDDADNTPIMGPAGTVHMTLRDLCAYAAEHLRGVLGTGTLLSAETSKVLHTPRLNQYACGWIKKGPDESIPHTVFWHNGSNTMWYALVVFVPETKMVVAVTSNDGDIAKAEAAAWNIVNASAHQLKTGGGFSHHAIVKSDNYPKKSPFAGVRWRASQPEVRLGEEWFNLVWLDKLPAAEIVTFSQQTYGSKWQKRFEEDLVELLTRMGHPPADKVTLVVQSLSSSEAWVRSGVPMTEANRRAIRTAASQR